MGALQETQERILPCYHGATHEGRHVNSTNPPLGDPRAFRVGTKVQERVQQLNKLEWTKTDPKRDLLPLMKQHE